jgi:asparagine N-glycosylation enzyme membrane subunit Stt3
MRKSTLYPLLLLCIPLIGNIFVDGFSWSFFDFIIMGSLILLFSSGINLVLLRQKSIQYRVTVIGVLVLIFLIIWAELAVGIWS